MSITCGNCAKKLIPNNPVSSYPAPNIFISDGFIVFGPTATKATVVVLCAAFLPSANFDIPCVVSLGFIPSLTAIAGEITIPVAPVSISNGTVTILPLYPIVTGTNI